MKSLLEEIEDFPEYFGIDLLKQLLKRSDSTIRRIIEKKHVNATKLPKLYFFKKSDVKIFLKESYL